MKQVLILILLLSLFSGCGGKQTDPVGNGHNHNHQGESHEGHDHRDESHEGHDHGKEAHDEHEGHDHDEHSEENHEEGHLEISKAKQKELGIQTQTVILKSGQSTGTRPGIIEANPDAQVLITSQASGTLKQVYARVGTSIAQGAPLALLSSPEVTALQSEFHEAEVEADLARKALSNKLALVRVGDEIRRPREEAQLEVVQAEAQRQAVSAKLKSAVLKNQRLETLLKEGIASQQQADESRAERLALEAELTKAQAALKIAEGHLEREKKIATSGLKVKEETFPAEAQLARAKEKMSHSRQKLVQLGANPQGHSGLVTLTSPIAGTVVERPHSVGSLVAAGEKIALVVNSDTVWVWLDLQRADLGFIEPGDPITLSLSSQSRKTTQGNIDYISPELSTKTQTYRARVVLENAPEDFSLGSFVEARLQNGSGKTQPAIPEKAIQFVEGKTVVYIETPGGFERTPVTVGPAVNDLVTVVGLEVGQKVAVEGVEQLKSLDLADTVGGHSH